MKFENADITDLIDWRWPNGIVCPHCSARGGRVYDLSATRIGLMKCRHCRKQFSVTSGTIFSRRKISIESLLAVLRLVSGRPDISASEVMRETGMSYKGAFYLTARVKESLCPR